LHSLRKPAVSVESTVTRFMKLMAEKIDGYNLDNNPRLVTSLRAADSRKLRGNLRVGFGNPLV
jgi:hypothetical protein